MQLKHHSSNASCLFIWYIIFLFKQNPREADAMTKVQAELDETKVVLVSLQYIFFLDLFIWNMMLAWYG